MATAYDTANIIIPKGGGYKAGSLYGWTPSSGSLVDFSVARAGATATRVNSSGLIESVAANVPRWDWAEGGSCPSLLIEPQRTNVALRSEEFDNAAWTKSNATISADATTSPDGTANADKLVEDSSNNIHFAGQTFSAVGSDTVYTASVFAKQSERNWIAVQVADASNFAANFDLDNGVVGTIQSNVTSAKITDFGNGWYHCSVTATVTTGTAPRVGVYLGDADNNLVYLGDGSSGAFIWGAQLETGSYATSYIPTVASTETRNADVISKTAIASLLGDSEGSIYLEASWFDPDEFGHISLSDGTTSNRVYIWPSTGGTRNARINLTGPGDLGSVSNASYVIAANTYIKFAARYATNDLTSYFNGNLVGQDTAVTTFPDATLTQINFADPVSVPFYGRLRALAVYDIALTDTELQNITT